MKIELIKPHTDDFGKEYWPGTVADWSQPDAERAIGAGVAKRAGENQPVAKAPKLAAAEKGTAPKP